MKGIIVVFLLIGCAWGFWMSYEWLTNNQHRKERRAEKRKEKKRKREQKLKND